MKRHPVAVLDACVLIPMPLADTLLRLAEPPVLFHARWSGDILTEVTRTLIDRFGKAPAKARYRESAMRDHFPDALVRNYRPLITKMKNHPKDRHVLAAATKCRADYLVTFNLKDFPSNSSAVGPSTLLKHLWNQDGSTVTARLHTQAAAIGISHEELLDRLAKLVPAFVKVMRES